MSSHHRLRKQPVLMVTSLSSLCVVLTMLSFWGGQLLADFVGETDGSAEIAIGYLLLTVVGLWWLARSTRRPPNRHQARLPRARTRRRPQR